jgi:hypothetical protein
MKVSKYSKEVTRALIDAYCDSHFVSQNSFYLSFFALSLMCSKSACLLADLLTDTEKFSITSIISETSLICIRDINRLNFSLSIYRVKF